MSTKYYLKQYGGLYLDSLFPFRFGGKTIHDSYCYDVKQIAYDIAETLKCEVIEIEVS